MTVLEAVRAGRIPEDVVAAARTEAVDPEALAAAITRGETLVCRNRARANAVPLTIGKGLRTKVNANIGTSLILLRHITDPNLKVPHAKTPRRKGSQKTSILLENPADFGFDL